MKKTVLTMMTVAMLSGCGSKQTTKSEVAEDKFNYVVEQFGDAQILGYRVNGFDELTLKQKELLYYLTQAALEGRDILFDQNGRYNLAIRRTLEAVYENYKGDKNSTDFKEMELYLKKIWLSNGIYHHNAEDKYIPNFSKEFFAEAVKSVDASKLPLREGKTVDDLLTELTPVMFDPNVAPKRMNQAAGEDLVLTSAVNFYEGVNQNEAEAFYNKMKDPNDHTPISYGLNSRLVKKEGVIKEEVWKVGGLYTQAIERINAWLEKAAAVAENPEQKAVINKLIEFNKSGDLKQFDEYAVLWVKDLNSHIDFVNGFTENYSDPLGMKATWESIVNFKNIEATKRTQIISDNAQWFEDNSPVAKQFKKEKVKGVSAKVITAAILGGDCYPTSPLGINLPNSNWIRRDHGSKSVTIDNISEAYEKAAEGNGFAEEFVWSDTERELLKKYALQADNMHTDLHECLGHGSGKLLSGVDPDALRAYGSPLEEARADLFALYYISDKKIVELGLLPNEEAYKAEYYRYMMNGLMTQLIRLKPGKSIEQAHMRNRQTIARWVLEHAKENKAVELTTRNGKTFVKINDYNKLRDLFGQLLVEVQRIKSEGDYEGAKTMIETYGVKVDPQLHAEILKRNEILNLPVSKGFLNPKYETVVDASGKLTDVKIIYTEGYAEQMLRYAKDYSPLPTYNE